MGERSVNPERSCRLSPGFRALLTNLKRNRAAVLTGASAVIASWLSFPDDNAPLDGWLIISVAGGLCGLGFEQLVQQIERRRFRFSLRTLLIATTLVGLIVWANNVSGG